MSDRRPTRSVVVAVALVLAGLLAGCASDPPTPAERRRSRVQARIEASFSKAQATCIMKTIDDDTIAALDRRSTLPTDDSLELYSNALVACVGGG